MFLSKKNKFALRYTLYGYGQQQFYEFVQEGMLPHVQGIEHKLFDPIRRKQFVTLLNLYKVRKPGSKKTPM